MLDKITISIHTPARGVTQDIPYVAAYLYDISIHTPARGVTIQRICDFAYADISIHTPARGVTSAGQVRSNTDWHFNPHSRKGSDLCVAFVILYFLSFQSTLPQGE